MAEHNPRQPIRVVLVDDHALVRQGFRRILEDDQSITVIGEAGNGLEGLALVKKLDPDVVVMDYRLPGLDGAAATRAVIEASGAAVLCLTAEANADEREEILRAGAVGLLEKGGTVDGLAEAIRGAGPG